MPIYSYLFRHKLAVLGLLILGVFWMGFQMIDSIYFGNAITAIANRDFQTFIRDMIIAFSAITLFAICIPINDHFRERLKQTMEAELRNDIADSINGLKYAQVKENDTGKYVSWMTNDLTIIDEQGFENVFDALQSLTAVLINAIMIVKYHYSLLILTLILAALMILGPKILQAKLERESKSYSQANEQLTETMTDTFDGYNALYILGQKHLINQRVRHASKRFGKYKVAFVTAKAENNGLINWISVLSQAAIGVLAGSLALNGIMKVGNVITCSSLAGVIFGNLTALSFAIVGLRTVKPIIKKFQLASSNSATQATSQATTQSTANLTNFQRAIDFDDVTFTYDNQSTPTLRKLNLRLEKNHKYALVAPSGFGKTTILNLIFGMYTDYQGTLTIDGQDYRQLPESQIQAQMLYVDQHPYIFTGNLRENILMGRTVDDQTFAAVCRICGIDEFVDELPDGFTTQLRHGGANLSGGQMQRVAMARMLLSDRPILLLDEITSALDLETALRVETNILQQSNKTVIMVTHNLHQQTKPLFDKIIDLTADVRQA
ncbi:hypothetical protein C6Y10_11665 [Lactiplantibacillus pentosus]|uniref:ABC transporter ATP-binding protein n=1 Tax=Lactiplantibacillus pentosus TaxID=1589 RepID=UPI000D01AB1D|nr:ABC transporter ATP-binding protein [Lactiplantibacillus pentosus]PRO83463.1 hypothetical protein C6Y10_11665 [Lactiplantibacillus pentosus]